MPFSTTASVISTDLDNMMRGLYRDNSDTGLTGTTGETTLKSVNIAGNTIGATGSLWIIACGTIAGAAGTKTIRVYLGATLVATITRGAAFTNTWGFQIFLSNVSVSAQRHFDIFSLPDSDAFGASISSTAVDTSQNQVLKVTGQLGNSGDTINQNMLDVFVVQMN
jgi:hypothetical protein